MKRKLFLQEIIGSKRKLLQLFFVITFILTVMPVTVTLFWGQHQESQKPDIELSGKNLYEDDRFYRYNTLEYFYLFLLHHEKRDEYTVFPVISRIANTITTDTLDEIEVKLEGYTLDYLKQYINENIIEGRLPKNKQEVVVSAYLLKYLDLEIGDDIVNASMEEEIYGDSTKLHLSLNPSSKEIRKYTIVGIVNDIDHIDSILTVLPEQMMPNQLLLYFTSPQAEKEIEQVFVDAASIGLIDFIGRQTDNYERKNSAEVTTIMTAIILLLFFVITLMALVMYLMKGANRKIGILKALGVSDKIVLQVFANGFLYLLLACFVGSILLVNVIYFVLNRNINSYYGFAVNMYHYSLQSLLLQASFTLIGYLIVVVMVYIRSTKIMPKDCMAMT